ncbi:hypothetical protein FQR65_LT03936 [Abscondita terminalis]|nr:hypothetical protein FQR65_LT03936 [Abscondita terminalis]
MEISFKGKTALVTGATTGIGREIAKKLIQCGADVIAMGISQHDLDLFQKEYPSLRTVEVDLRDWNATKDALKKFDAIDLLVNNAGVAILDSVVNISEKSVDETFAVNVKSLINLTQVVAKNLIARKMPGSIVNISSQGSMRAMADHGVYCASKAAVDGFTRVSAMELGPHNIRVNTVNPTVVMTDLGRMAWSDPTKADPLKNKIPLRRFAEINDVVDVVMFLLSDKASMVNGVSLPVDGGCTAVL